MSHKISNTGLELWLTKQFHGAIWNIHTHPSKDLLFIEIRDVQLKEVRFSAIDLSGKKMLWDEITLEEKWWVSLTEVSENLLLFNIYTDTNNPDRKSLISFDFNSQEIKWWRNNFSIGSISESHVSGIDTSMGAKPLVLNIADGVPVTNPVITSPRQNFSIIKPLQYYEQTNHFETVKTFLNTRFQLNALSMIEYLEINSLIIISVYAQEENDLVNYLLVVDEAGNLVIKETIGRNLQGIGVDTFFIVSGYLIFVQNRSVFVCYKLV
ncbi:DUF4905 domain-containing protein [Chryseosolibacter indicus]|uniref:DUF4905 domain-containing protein n=1 Tax=Chryseosolibacter indicus TaxID=2782351 RepID=A0ABS5VRM7_9BACT|nr:DUF4905 domain-containing protein [Chryseosolibacter indicus]MBT1704001.1 DUF4905 domain-containing protein [Chryseosolibacter indicus]